MKYFYILAIIGIICCLRLRQDDIIGCWRYRSFSEIDFLGNLTTFNRIFLHDNGNFTASKEAYIVSSFISTNFSESDIDNPIASAIAAQFGNYTVMNSNIIMIPVEGIPLNVTFESNAMGLKIEGKQYYKCR